MVMYNIHNEVVQRSFRSHICNFATLFFICVGAITFISPLFIAYHSQGFWLKESIYQEQAEVQYKHDFILLLKGVGITSLIGYSTLPNFNVLLGDNVRIPIIKSHEVDINYDGKNDYLEYEIKVPLSETESINSVQLLLFFDYKLHKFTSLHMECLAYIFYDSALAGSQFITEGNLKFRQKYPLPHKGSYSKYKTTIVDSNLLNTDTFNLQTILNTYQARNVSTDFIGRYPVWIAGSFVGNPFVAKGKIYYPEETILYRPGFWQLIKNAWIQYLAVLFIFLYIFGHVKRFVYENQLVSTVAQKVHVD